MNELATYGYTGDEISGECSERPGVHAGLRTYDVEATVGLAGDVDLALLQLKGVDKVLPEALELGGQLHLVGNVGGALVVADSDRLLHPDTDSRSVSTRFTFLTNSTHKLVRRLQE